MSTDSLALGTTACEKRKEISEKDETRESVNCKKPKMNKDDQAKKKHKKILNKARALGMAHEIKDDQVIVYPKLILKQMRGYASMKDVRKLIFSALKMGKQTPFAELPEFTGVQPIEKVILIDVPILDPNALNLPLETTWVSKLDTPEVYEEIMSSPIQEYVDKEGIISFVSAVGFDQYKRVGNRFMDLLEMPLSKSDLKKKREEEEKEPEGSLSIAPEALILTAEELKLEDFPIHSSLDSNSVLEDNWIETTTGKSSDVKKLVALDCEMCKTVNGYAITRVALIDQNHNVLLNELVKPTEEITDYVTHISGVSEEMLMEITTSLADIQKKLLGFIDGDTIIVGHGLMNDLKCLKMKHPYIIDTSIIYHHKNGPPYKPSLKDLATRYLKRSIQVERAEGHDPCEDAIASLELLERKLRYGMNYGHTGLSQTETILAYLDRQEQQAAVIECNAGLSIAMKRMLTQNIEKEYFPEDTDEKVCERIIDLHPSKKFIFARLDLPQETEQTRQEKFSLLFKKIYRQAEPQTVFCITTGYRTNQQREELREKRIQYKKNLKKMGLESIPEEERWSQADELVLDQIADATRRGLVFINVKNPL
ncbi:hypothetical protein G6F37_004667 [Rhizopus arrhizus]|nr:hypothetical protein G6F38_004889 [Rhizopus arrhizus]KAG1159686.1 hypothetical protein G6F37_004667 [Rhizopus arrhizus]